MCEAYSNAETPRIDFPAAENSVCGGFSVNQWYRVLILSNDAETEKAYVAFLDYGGFAYIDYCNLRQLRSDFLTLPFQAQGCILHGVKPIGGMYIIPWQFDKMPTAYFRSVIHILFIFAEDWTQEATDHISAVTSGNTCVTQIAGSTIWDEPFVLVFVRKSNVSIIILNYILWLSLRTPQCTVLNHIGW